MIKVFLVDDHQIYRDGIKSLLSKNDEIEIVGESWQKEDAITQIKTKKVDVLILDLSLGSENGIDLLIDLKNKNIDPKTVVLTMHDGSSYLNRCLELGVMGYVLKNESAAELCNAIKEVYGNKSYLSKEASRILHSYFTRRHVGEVNLNQIKVTNREKEVLELISAGLSGQQISEKLFISTRTVETHKRNLFKKLSVNNSIELINKAKNLAIIN